MENKAHGNMYPGVVTWNPLGGECSHKCGYCSTQTLMRYPGCKAKYFGPIRLYDEVLRKSPGEGKTIFVVAQNDLFAENVPSEWILKVLQRCKAWDNTWLFQTKNPARFLEFLKDFPENTILCTTIETNRFYKEMGNTPLPVLRADAMSQIKGFRKFVTCEPLFDFYLEEFVELIKWTGAEKINLGADSKRHNLPEPSKEKVLALIDKLKKFTTIDKKTNLARLLK